MERMDWGVGKVTTAKGCTCTCACGEKRHWPIAAALAGLGSAAGTDMANNIR